MCEDIRYAFRQFRKSPGFAAAAVVTLSLGIASSAAMFSLIEGVLLSPPPYSNPDRLVLLSNGRIDGRPHTQGVSLGQWSDWKASSRTLEPPALYNWTFNFLVLKEGSESLGGMVVTQDYFKVLGVRPVLGREFQPNEASRPKVPPTAIIIGHDLWRRRFNSDPNIVGKTITLSRYPAPFPVVGVMPAGLRFLPAPGAAAEPNYDVNAPVDFWLLTAPDETQIRNRGWNVVSRLKDGVTPESARTELAGFMPRHAQADSNLNGLAVNVRPVIEVLNREAGALLVPLFGFVALLFFVACINVAGLFVARGLQRHREYAMRAALGAPRMRLFRQVITESGVLSLIGAVLGAALAVAIVALFKSFGGRAIPRADMITVGWPVLLFAAAAAAIAALVSGVLPALRASSPGHADALKGGRGSSAGRTERRLLGAIATAQIVLTVALLGGAALLIRTANKLETVRAGYDIENILAMTVTSVGPPNDSQAFHQQVLDRVAALPSVTKVAFAWGVPLTGNRWPGNLEIVNQGDAGTESGTINAPFRAVTPDYFALMGMQLVSGRGFTPLDNREAPPVLIVNQTLAARHFPGVDPIGRFMKPPGTNPNIKPMQIVGIVADTRTDALSKPAEPEVYVSFWQNGAFSKHLVVRASSNPTALTAEIRDQIRTVEPTAAIEKVTTMEAIRRESLASSTFALRLLLGFAIVATGLALVGIYGVLSLSVGSRTKEIAVRKAIGAQENQVLRAVLGEGGRLILIGVVLGAIVAVVVGRGLEGMLFEVQSADPVSLGSAALLFGTVALIACVFPAMRAARTDLLAALHDE